eukprot:CAMPEP_0198606352 /NCGR_PEP_ID=MMETSP1462-20131121/154853_1 /TAXON_ID=1333877 /ORGANISM="Brandtodinium nutriculum, Strain RCC3387" /LENGTH=199 /DNA_ID=CAMNT_0044338157 /DNA_START=134 /DNA_END=733 /DNA_ORIENTATION=-
MISALGVTSSEQDAALEAQPAQAPAAEFAMARHGAFCVQDPGNPHYFVAKKQEATGWSQGDECYAQGGGVAPYGGKACVGGSGLQACMAAAQAAGLSASALPAFCVQDPGNPHYFVVKSRPAAGWSQGDECYAQGGGVAPYGGKACVGGSGLQACLSAAQAAGLSSSALSVFCVQDPRSPHYFRAKTRAAAGWSRGGGC